MAFRREKVFRNKYLELFRPIPIYYTVRSPDVKFRLYDGFTTGTQAEFEGILGRPFYYRAGGLRRHIIISLYIYMDVFLRTKSRAR